MDNKTGSGRTTFPFISSEAFVSQTDKAALQTLTKMPLVPKLVHKFNELSGDRISYVQNAAESVRCGPKQFKTVYGLMREACSILHIPEPELYIRYSESYNAYTAGMNRTFIVLQSALVESFSDEEILYIIGHEVGHIKCGHILYQTVGRLLIPMLEALGQVTMGMGQLAGMGLVAGFFEWMRQAEYSCDRAGLLVCQDPQVAFSATMKMGSGSTRFDGERDVEVFMQQARQHSESVGLEGVAKVFQFLMYNWQLTHPQVVYRAKGLDEWVRSGAYERILSGEYARDATGGGQLGRQVRCKRCQKMVSATEPFCSECGSELDANPVGTVTTATVECSACKHVLPAGVKYCPNCSTKV